ncbi:MAG: TlpA disulfide reductase family protein [Acidobacteria bacterium]|nr:TlpA disulfide reductase family protein [Acidobacteriota bacterium]
MSAAVPRDRRTVEGVWVTMILLLTVSACGGTDSPHPERTSADNAQWAVVQEYLDLQAAWEEQAGVMTGDGTVEEHLQRAEEEHGQLPDATAALAAARQLVVAGGPYTIEAAEFLIARSARPIAKIDPLRHERLEELIAEVGPAEAFAALHAAEEVMWEALIAKIDPDWSVVQHYLDEPNAWVERIRAAAPEGGGPPSMQERPSVVRAVAAARAILNAEGMHAKTVEAAEFLVDHAWDVPRGDWHGAVGARALATHAPPDYERWPRVLAALDMAPRPSGTWVPVSPVDEFFAEMASNADHPVLRAAAQYHLASGLMREAKRSMMSSSEQDHAARRERALDQAKGLSAGVENETFDDSMRRWGDETPRTFAQAEADLIASIEHATVGSTLPEWTGRRLDGTEEPLSAYRGRVLLIDFWATWCVPCIDALQELREMVADLPADRFALLAVSVDEELETVTEFMEREAMPWYNWHLGRSSDLERILDVRGFPTYLLTDENGRVLSNGDNSLAELRCMAERAVAGEAPDCPAAEWLGAQ